MLLLPPAPANAFSYHEEAVCCPYIFLPVFDNTEAAFDYVPPAESIVFYFITLQAVSRGIENKHLIQQQIPNPA